MGEAALAFANPTTVRVAVRISDPHRAAAVREGLSKARMTIVSNLAGADLLLTDNEDFLSRAVPCVFLGEARNAPGCVPIDASIEQIDAAVMAVAAGLVVRSPPKDRSFGPATSQEDESLLTPRELQVLDRIAAGLTNKGIARELGISLHTVKFHVESIFRKLGARTRTHALAIAQERRLLQIIHL